MQDLLIIICCVAICPAGQGTGTCTSSSDTSDAELASWERPKASRLLRLASKDARSSAKLERRERVLALSPPPLRWLSMLPRLAWRRAAQQC